MKMLKFIIAGLIFSSSGSEAATPFDPNAQPYGYVAQPALTSFNIGDGAQALFLNELQYTSGNLHKYAVSATGTIGTADLWTGGAAGQLDLQNWNTGRYIVTVKSDGTKIPFRYSSLSVAQRVYFGDATTGLAVVNYLRGDRSGEAQLVSGGFRDRTTVLGDIVHSTPRYVKYNPVADSTVYVPANDGMVHAFNAATGAERFAYIPSLLLSRLSILSSTSYTHQYFNDGQLESASFDVNATPADLTDDTRVLVGGMGGGGKGLFALDITNPVVTSETDAATRILWEISNATTGYGNLGYTYGRPVFVQLPAGSPAMLAGNGYNNSGNGHAVLYLINPLTGAKIAEIDTGSGTTSSPNGLSGVTALDTTGDGREDVAYAGDIDGQLWKFDLTANTASLLLTTNPAQAITVAPNVGSHPTGSGLMITFATGRTFTAADLADTSIFAAYGIWDGAPVANNTLLTQTQSDATYGVAGAGVRTASNNLPNWSVDPANPDLPLHYGWKAEFDTEPGLRVLGDSLPHDSSTLLFLAMNPVLNVAGQTNNWVYRLNNATGGANAEAQFDLNQDGNLNTADHLADADGNIITTTDGIPVAVALGDALRSQAVVLSTGVRDLLYAVYAGEPQVPPVASSSSSSSSTSSTSTSSTSTSSTSSSSGGPGVSGGHFDFDLYCFDSYCSNSTNRSAGQVYNFTDSESGVTTLNVTHVHQYDDIYDVTGVNMLNASQSKMNLEDLPVMAPAYVLVSTNTAATTVTGLTSTSNPNNNASTTSNTSYATVDGVQTKTVVTTTVQNINETSVTTCPGGIDRRGRCRGGYITTYTYDRRTTVVTEVYEYSSTEFKVLVANQAYNPAAKISIGGAAYVPVYDYQTSGTISMGSLPTYTLGTVNSLVVNLPLDAFLAKDWGTGVTRAGLHPTYYNCVVKGTYGPADETRNGALTIQIVRADTGDTDVKQNVLGRPELGYRLVTTSKNTKLLAEYTMFWHHPNNLCMADSGWTKSPAEESGTDAVAATPATGSADPQDGIFVVSSSSTSSSSTSSSSTSSSSTSSTSTSSTSTSSTSSSTTSGSGGVGVPTTGITGIGAAYSSTLDGNRTNSLTLFPGDYGRMSWHLIAE